MVKKMSRGKAFRQWLARWADRLLMVKTGPMTSMGSAGATFIGHGSPIDVSAYRSISGIGTRALQPAIEKQALLPESGKASTASTARACAVPGCHLHTPERIHHG